MAETLQQPERLKKANEAVTTYDYLPPRLFPQHLDEMLDGWLEACEGVSLSHEGLRSHAWMHVERAIAASSNGVGEDVNNAEAACAFMEEQIIQAEEKFDAARKHPHADESFKATIEYELQAARMLHAFWVRDIDLLRVAIPAYKGSQAILLESALNDYNESNGVQSRVLAEATAVAMMVMDKSSRFIPVPAPPRMRGYGVDAGFRSDLIFIIRDQMCRAAVSDDAGDWQLHIPYGDLRAEKGPLSDSMKVVAEIVRERRKGKLGFSVAGTTATRRSIEHPVINGMAEKIVARLLEQLDNPSQTELDPEQQHNNPLEWYEKVEAGRHPYIASSVRLDHAISEIETAMAEGEVPSSAAYTAGWMYVEAGMGRAMQSLATTVNPHGDFDRAEDLFIYAYERTEEGTMDRFDTLLAYAAAPMYRAIATGEQPLFPYYAQQLAALSENILGFYAGLKDKTSPEAMRADQMIQVLTTCLLFASDSTESFVVVPSSPRQGQEWHLAVWELTHTGYVPQKGGRLVMAEKMADKRDIGAVTLTTKVIGQHTRPRRTATLCHLIDETTGAPATAREAKERDVAIQKARKESLQVATTAVN
jgi:hypothetical protein